MKSYIFLILSLFTTMVTSAQTRAENNLSKYEAANWSTWFLDNPQQIIISPPPTTALTKAEMKEIKKNLKNPEEKKLAIIKYWDAGAPAYRWNQIITKLIEENPEAMLKMPGSWTNIAIYNATVLAWKEKLKYKRKRPGEVNPSLKSVINAPQTYSYPCEHTVTAAAAATILAYFFPARADSILQLAQTASQSRVDAGVQFPSDVEAGWILGKQVGNQIIERAKKDGAGKAWNGTMNKDPKKWTGAYPFGISLSTLSPMFIRSADQFRPPSPPDFEKEMIELREFKQTGRSRFLAHYWANTSDAWSEVAAKKMFEYRISDDAPTVASIYCILNIAYYDFAIAVFDAKYAYWGIRPNQYDTSYKPLIPTLPFPGYPSGHAGMGAVSATILTHFFPVDSTLFQQMAQDCADSRFYGGIHFRSDNEVALRMGEALGKNVLETWFKK